MPIFSRCAQPSWVGGRLPFSRLYSCSPTFNGSATPVLVEWFGPFRFASELLVLLVQTVFREISCPLLLWARPVDIPGLPRCWLYFLLGVPRLLHPTLGPSTSPPGVLVTLLSSPFFSCCRIRR
ncbi:unnamed protein product [Pylaiella littoralis]